MTPQHQQALQKANRVRRAQAALRHSVAAGETSIREALGNPAAQTMNVYDLLRQLPRWGPTRVRKLCWRERINERRTIGALTERQKRALIEGTKR